MKQIVRVSSYSSRSERGALRLWAGLALVALIAVAALIWWPEGEMTMDSVNSTGVDAAIEEHAHAESELYTCGMHPQVLSESPGTCPICQMDLTPVKVDRSAAIEVASSGERKIKYWRAPMDPDFVSDSPGKSPMGMDLVPVYEDDAAESSDLAITISPVVVQNMGVRTAAVEKRAVAKTVRTVGSIDYDEQRVRDVTTKFDGWIEDLYADYTGQNIKKGMPLFSVYSPQIYSSQEEYLLALRNKDSVQSSALPEATHDMHDLAESSRLRLELFDISEDQIEELAKRGKPEKTMTIRSPYTGIVVEKMAREGMQVRPGMKLYTIADLSRVWVYVDIYENEVSFVKLGQNAEMDLSYLPGKVFHGKVIYVYPFVDTDTRTVKVRLEFDNPHLQLKPGMFADVRIKADLGRVSLQVPRSAVIDTGERQIAFVAQGQGRFEPRSVRTGVSLGDDYIEILDGLHDGELVVTSGQFLLDSESKLREAVLKMMKQKRGAADTPVAGGAGIEQQPGIRPEGDVYAVAAELPSIGSASELADLAAPVIAGYLELQQVLAQDGRTRLAAAVSALNDSISGFLAGAAGESPGNGAARQRATEASTTVGQMEDRSMDGVRAEFGDLSRQVTDLVALIGPENIDAQLYAFFCPMAGSGWIQRGEQPRNPYYGFSMNQCGDSVDLLKRQ